MNDPVSSLRRLGMLLWVDVLLVVLLGAVFLQALGRLDSARFDIVEDLSFIPDAYRTPIKTFSPSRPPYRGSVLLLHGYGSSKEMMQSLAIELARDGFYAMCLDLPGHGDSQQSFSRDKNLPALESAYLNLLERALIMPRKVALVGHSMGGGLVVNFGAARSEVNAVVAIGSIPAGVTPETPRNLLLITAENDLPSLRQAAEHMLEAAGGQRASLTDEDFARGTARHAAVIPGADHLSVLFQARTSAELREWLQRVFPQGPAPDPAPAPRPWFWLVAAQLCALLLFVPLVRVAAALYPLDEESISVTGLTRGGFLTSWAAACAAGSLGAAYLPGWPGIPIHVADYVGWAYLLAAAVLGTALFARGVRFRCVALPAVRAALFAVGGFLFLYWSFGLVAHSEWLHLSLGQGRWAVWPRVMLFLAPLILLLEIPLRGFQERKGIWLALPASWLLHGMLLAGLMLPAWFRLGRVDWFLLPISGPFLLVFFGLFSVLAAGLYQATRSALCSGLWSIVTYAWIYAAPFYWK